MNEQLVTCAALTKRYGGKRALAGVDLELGRGRIVGLLGPNGSGKTTMIKILCGLLQPTEGAVLVDGQPVGPYTKSIISYLPDRMYFADWMKATDLFDLFADFYKDFDRTKAMSMCASLGVTPSDRLKSMSKGTKEKVQLVLVMARKAQLYLLDEPIAGVAPAARYSSPPTSSATSKRCWTRRCSSRRARSPSTTRWTTSASGRARAWTRCSARSSGLPTMKEVRSDVWKAFKV